MSIGYLPPKVKAARRHKRRWKKYKKISCARTVKVQENTNYTPEARKKKSLKNIILKIFNN